MRKLLRGIVVVLGVAICAPSFSWDDYGHRLVARVAYSKLAPHARAVVDQLLGGVEAFVHASVWADQIKSKRPETRPWHYVNIPLQAGGYDQDRDCLKANCIVSRLEYFIGVLKADESQDHKREALRFVIHLVADIHQPLHCANNNDRGGNDVAVVWGNRKTNLHEVWDHYVLVNTLNQVGEVTAGGGVVDWCNESHAIAQRTVYPGLPSEGSLVSDDYLRNAKIAATDQLAKAAARLAAVLDESLAASH
jgi:hypothetical protein